MVMFGKHIKERYQPRNPSLDLPPVRLLVPKDIIRKEQPIRASNQGSEISIMRCEF